MSAYFIYCALLIQLEIHGAYSDQLIHFKDRFEPFQGNTFATTNRKPDLDLKNQQGTQPFLRRKVKAPALGKTIHDAAYTDYVPGMPAQPFQLPCLSTTGFYNLRYPDDFSTDRTAAIFAVYDKRSGFSQCFFNCSSSVTSLLSLSTANTKFVFIASDQESLAHLKYFHNKYKTILQNRSDIFHFAALPLDSLGTWLSDVPEQWRCLDHNCGFSQIRLQNDGHIAVFPRLDARYDWLPSPSNIPGSKSFPVVFLRTGCEVSTNQTGNVVVLLQSGCSYFQKVKSMGASGAAAVLVMSDVTGHMVDMNCEGQDCATQLRTPATSVLYLNSSQWKNATVTFQQTSGHNLFFAIDRKGLLAEVGWALYPSMAFLGWQAQWFDYMFTLESSLRSTDVVIDIFNGTEMQGASGAQTYLTLPALKDFQSYSKLFLDMSLSCPGSRDKDCPHWDHTVSLKVCCQVSCQPTLEIGRWITPFRRRVGRWLTDITLLMPLLQGHYCHFVMTTAPWAMTWKPSLALRLSGKTEAGSLVPATVTPLYNQDSVTFDHKYNTRFQPFTFTVSSKYKKVYLYAVITGHGSDENGCGEFCVTSHAFTLNNNRTFTRTFSSAGTPLGCASKVPEGVLPNEHGTWLYGRDGWCDGQDVKPWIIDLTPDLNRTGSESNRITYRGTFNGTDPDPKHNPGVMIISSYLVYLEQQL